jgi:hypothetical protein
MKITIYVSFIASLWGGGTTRTNSMVPEPEGSSLHLQEPTNDPYPLPGESSARGGGGAPPPPPPPNQFP